jgi:hypothetical protein
MNKGAADDSIVRGGDADDEETQRATKVSMSSVDTLCGLRGVMEIIERLRLILECLSGLLDLRRLAGGSRRPSEA